MNPRRVAFLIILAFMIFGPFYRQVLDGDARVFRQWTMFGGNALGIVDATFIQHYPDGREVVLDRYAVLGYESRRDAPPEVRQILGRRGTWTVARRLCEAIGPDADIRVVSREATRDGWRSGYTGSENLCGAPAPDPSPWDRRDTANDDRTSDVDGPR